MFSSLEEVSLKNQGNEALSRGQVNVKMWQQGRVVEQNQWSASLVLENITRQEWNWQSAGNLEFGDFTWGNQAFRFLIFVEAALSQLDMLRSTVDVEGISFRWTANPQQDITTLHIGMPQSRTFCGSMRY